MLTQAVESYLEVRRAMGFALHSEGSLLQSFAKYSDGAGRELHLHRNCDSMGRHGAINHYASAPTWSSHPTCAIPSSGGSTSSGSTRRVRV